MKVWSYAVWVWKTLEKLAMQTQDAKSSRVYMEGSISKPNLQLLLRLK